MIDSTKSQKEQARERRNRLLDSAAAAELSLTDGVREMRAISGMTEEDFARHRGVNAQLIKELELGQGDPTVVTLNQIGGFFGLKVAFIPVRKTSVVKDELSPEAVTMLELSAMLERVKEEIGRQVCEAIAGLNIIPRSIPETASPRTASTEDSSGEHIHRHDALGN